MARKLLIISSLLALSLCLWSAAQALADPMLIMVESLKYTSGNEELDTAAYGKAMARLLEQRLAKSGAYAIAATSDGPRPVALVVGEVFQTGDTPVKKGGKQDKNQEMLQSVGEMMSGRRLPKNTIQVHINAQLVEVKTGQILGAASGSAQCKIPAKKKVAGGKGLPSDGTNDPENCDARQAMEAAADKIATDLTAAADKARSLLTR